MKCIRCLGGSYLHTLCKPTQQVPNPPFALNIHDLEANLGIFLAQTEAQGFAEGHFAVAVLFLEEGDGGFYLFRLQFDPLSTYLDKRHFEFDELLELLGGEFCITDGDVPVVGDDAVETEESSTDFGVCLSLEL